MLAQKWKERVSLGEDRKGSCYPRKQHNHFSQQSSTEGSQRSLDHLARIVEAVD